MASATDPTLIIRRARALTMTGSQGSPGTAPLGIVEDATIAVAGEQIVWVGGEAGSPAPGARTLEVDAGGNLVAPGFVEPHSHLLFAGDRAGELALRLGGQSYLEIARQGGGILSTVRATRAASDEQLLLLACARLSRLVEEGVTTVEVKTGYGLSLKEELRLLRLIRAASERSPCEVMPTLLGLHAVPEEIDRASWVRVVVEELTPAASALGAHGCDAFCEEGAFTPDECRAALAAGTRAGLVPHLHADQLTAGGGAELAAELGCASAGHLERTGPAGIAALARAGTVATLLPLAAWFLREARPAQAAPFLAAGVPVALGGNLNPGSQRIEGHSFLLAAGCLVAGLTPAQALWGATAGAARALRLGDRGVLAPEKRADLVLHAATDPAHLPYHAGVNHVRLVIRGGAIAVDRRGLPAPAC
ncbi:MAG TPA: imidazolonepropionase [Myxococcales bacterium]|nr:imidazolonepropionase [Myxococcales bacterium]